MLAIPSSVAQGAVRKRCTFPGRHLSVRRWKDGGDSIWRGVDHARSLIDPQGVRIFNYCAVPPKRATC
jgi:hypothetical protein